MVEPRRPAVVYEGEPSPDQPFMAAHGPLHM